MGEPPAVIDRKGVDEIFRCRGQQGPHGYAGFRIAFDQRQGRVPGGAERHPIRHRRQGRAATVRVELNGARGPESFIGRLADLEYVNGVQAKENTLVVELADPPHETPDLVAVLVGAGARITSVVEDAQTLEEAYLSLVGEVGERDTDR